MQLTKKELRTALVNERNGLIALVANASEEQLNSQSLCEGWTNKNIIGHILGYELGYKDALDLIRKKDKLDAINNRQAKRYESCSAEQLVQLLSKGQKRVLRLLRLSPSPLFNKKLIRVPNGRISPAQIFGDLAMDRAIHYLDIADPLAIKSTITDPTVMDVSLKFVLRSIDLLNPGIPKEYYGSFAHIKLSGLSGSDYYWKIGTGLITVERPNSKTAITVAADTNDFLFTIVGRHSLIRTALKVQGTPELKQIFETSLHANKLWEN